MALAKKLHQRAMPASLPSLTQVVLKVFSGLVETPVFGGPFDRCVSVGRSGRVVAQAEDPNGAARAAGGAALPVGVRASSYVPGRPAPRWRPHAGPRWLKTPVASVAKESLAQGREGGRHPIPKCTTARCVMVGGAFSCWRRKV